MKIVDGRPYIDQIKGLIKEYTKRLGRELTFQNLEEELADPAKKYTAPEGELLVALEAGFHECEPYYDNPMEDVIYFKKEL